MSPRSISRVQFSIIKSSQNMSSKLTTIGWNLINSFCLASWDGFPELYLVLSIAPLCYDLWAACIVLNADIELRMGHCLFLQPDLQVRWAGDVRESTYISIYIIPALSSYTIEKSCISMENWKELYGVLRRSISCSGFTLLTEAPNNYGEPTFRSSVYLTWEFSYAAKQLQFSWHWRMKNCPTLSLLHQ